MHPVRQKQLLFGTLWGSMAFLTGLACTFYAVGDGVLPETERLRAAAWFFLGANGIGVEWSQLGGSALHTQRVNLLTEYPRFSYLKVLPWSLSVLGAILVAESIGYSKRPRHIIENCLSVVLGYFAVGVVTIYISNALPSIEAIVLILLVLAVALFLGGSILSALAGSLAFVGVVSIWGLLFIGLIAIGGGLILLDTFAPLVYYPSIGAAIASVLLMVARKARL